MPTLANITVKKHDGTTDVVYVALQGAAGDRQKAVWRQDAFAASQANRPTFELTAKPSSDGTQRILEGKFVYPELVTDSTTGVVSTRLREVASFATTIDVRSTDSSINEMAAQFANLVRATLVQEAIKQGYAPR